MLSRHLKSTVLVLILASVLGGLLVGCVENFFLYFPSKYPQGNWDVSEVGFSIEDCFLNTSDGVKIHAWFVPQAGAKATILWFHGNGGNISGRLEHLKIMRELLNVNIFAVDYRGYGRSEGSPSEKGLYLDAEAAYNYLLSRSDVSKNSIYIYGQSLGAAVAAYLAHKGFGAGTILEAGFSSLLDAAADVYPWMPARYITRERYDSVERIPQIKQPVLIIHGTEDDIVLVKHAHKLYQAASEPKELLILQGVGHNDVYLTGGNEFWGKLKEFIGDKK